MVFILLQQTTTKTKTTCNPEKSKSPCERPSPSAKGTCPNAENRGVLFLVDGVLRYKRRRYQPLKTTKNVHSNQKKVKLAFLAIVVAGLLAAPMEKSQAQEQENYAWITYTNGMTWKKDITGRGNLSFADSEKTQIAQILVPEHALIDNIDVKDAST